MRQFTVDERRARLGVRHHLAATAKHTDVAEVARSLIGLHGTDPASVYLAAAARLKKPQFESIDRALYDDRTIVRMLAMRRTMFVVPSDLFDTVQVAAANAIAAKQRKTLVEIIDSAGSAPNASRWLAKVEAATLAALDARGEATAADLAKDVPALREQFTFGAGKKWESMVSVGTRVLLVLSAEGRIVRGRPRGSWISTQYRWVPRHAWVAVDDARRTVDEARCDLVTQWLRSFGPATVADVKWWTGWTLGETRKALGRADTVEVDLDGVAGVALADDLEKTKAPKPWVALLPALDPTAMGWTARDWYLGEHRTALFDRSGNIGPTIWSNGRIVGGWAQRSEGDVVTRLLEDVGRDVTAAVGAEAAWSTTRLGDRRFTSRFPTPLERELRG